MPGVEHCCGERESLLLGGVMWADETVLLLLFVRVVGGKPLVLKFVQLKIITGELSCKSGNDEEMVDEPLIDLVNFEAHVATGEWLLVWAFDVKGFCEVSMDLRVLNRRMLLMLAQKFSPNLIEL